VNLCVDCFHFRDSSTLESNLVDGGYVIDCCGYEGFVEPVRGRMQNAKFVRLNLCNSAGVPAKFELKP
jgi:hypothetical protein